MPATESHHFSVPDYIVFALVLAISALIGFYYACTGGRQKTVDEFLMADRKMSWFPVAASLLASFISAITILGTPGEIYSFGTVYVWLVVSYPIAMWLSAYVYLPVYYHLGITSVYEYIEMRFDKLLKWITVFIYILTMMLYMGIVLYIPSTALMQVTGLNLWISILSVGAICTLYTTIGGMKAVLWTDTFQIVIMYAGIIAVIIQGCINEGGGAAVWETARVSGRLDFYDVSKIFEVNPRTRHTIWSQLIGGVFMWTSVYAVNQAQIQRALTLPTIRHIKLVYWVNAPGFAAFVVMCAFCGLIIYSHYKLCDQLQTGLAAGKDQLYPLYVVETLGQYPGLPGLVLASVFSGSLSSVSSGLNALAAVTFKDLIQVLKPNLTETQGAWISKILALGYGVISIGVACIARELGAGILSAAYGLFSILGGPVLGLFSLGMFFPTANKWGALVGLLVAIVINGWIGLAQLLTHKPYVYKYPTSVAGCNITDNFTLSDIPTSEYTYDPSTFDLSAHHRSGIESLYDLSYFWISAIGTTLVVIVGLLVSLCTGNNRKSPVDRKLLTPIIHQWCCCLPNNARDVLSFGISPPDQTCINERETRLNKSNSGIKDDADEERETKLEDDPHTYSNGSYQPT